MTATTTDRPAPMPAWVASSLAAAGAAFLFLNGAILGYGIGHDDAFSGWNFGAQAEPTVPTSTERLQYHRLAPMDMRLSIVPRAEFDRLVGPGTIAFTYVRQRPCRIVVPDDWMIDYRPSAGTAIWDDSGLSNFAADILAHEILHCQIGKWHPEL